MAHPQHLLSAIRHFSDLDLCQDFLVKLHWPNGVTCPTCGSADLYYKANRRVWQCKTKHPRQQFTVKVGTIMEDSPIGLDKWLAAMWMIGNDKNGVSSYEIARALDVTQKTAWFLLHRIRLAMQEDGDGLFGGTVEVDETFIGGKARNMHKTKRAAQIKGRGSVGKVAVMGLLERHGMDTESRVRTRIVPNTRKGTLTGIVRENVTKGATVYSDALSSYDPLADQYTHEVVDHAEEYVRGKVHTNGIENFWSLLKRGLKGTYVSVEPFHLFRYLDEQAFRYNNRKLEGGDGARFEKIAAAVVGKRLTYAELIGNTTPA